MFLNQVRITRTEPCVADPEKIRVKAELSDDITQVMPYLNTIIKNAIFNREAPILTFTKEYRLIVIYPRYLTMAKALHLADVVDVLDWLKEMINETWERKDEIVPNYEIKKQPSVLQVYSWLPKTNCKKCGEQNCFAFLVAPSTDPAWTPLFLRASAIVMETGGFSSHGSIVAREYGIPAVINIPGVMKVIDDNRLVTVDGDEGKVYL